MTSFSKYKVLDNKLDTVIKSHEKILQLLETLREEVRNNRALLENKLGISDRTLTSAINSKTSSANKGTKSVSSTNGTDLSRKPSSNSDGSKRAPVSKKGKVIDKSSDRPGSKKNSGSKPSAEADKGFSKTGKPSVVRTLKANTEGKKPINESLDSKKMTTATIELPLISEVNTSTELNTQEFDLIWDDEASPSPEPQRKRKKTNPKRRKAVTAGQLASSLKSGTKSKNSNLPRKDKDRKQALGLNNTLKAKWISSKVLSNKRKRDEAVTFNSSKKIRDTRLLGSKVTQREVAGGASSRSSLFL